MYHKQCIHGCLTPANLDLSICFSFNSSCPLASCIMFTNSGKVKHTLHCASNMVRIKPIRANLHIPTIHAFNMLPPPPEEDRYQCCASMVSKALVAIVRIIVPDFLLFSVATVTLLFSDSVVM
jgi:hypothetical protein